jgi:hypothetical protein
MLARYFWRKCEYLEWSQCKDPIDSIWVEATESEAEQYIFPHLSQESIKESKIHAEKSFEIAKELANPVRPFCFLVSQNLSNIYACHAYYPFHQLWNGYSPFERMPLINLNTLSDITKIEIPEEENG